MSVVSEVERVVDPYGPGARVVRVTLRVGGLRAVVPEALEFCYMAASRGSRAEGAALVIEQTPVRVACPACAREWIAEHAEFFCPVCDGPVRVLTGKELVLQSVEIETVDAAEAADAGGT